MSLDKANNTVAKRGVENMHRLHRKAFTTLEILTVIAVIAILLSLSLLGMKSLTSHAKTKQTKQLMETCRAWQDEFSIRVGLSVLPSAQLDLTGGADVSATGSYRNGAAVQTTGDVNTAFRNSADSKTSFDQMPAQQLLTPTLSNGPVLLDGWGNPIIWVPGAGVKVNVGATATVIKAPDGRPFFASAGPDGDFSKGDDNVYSFQN